MRHVQNTSMRREPRRVISAGVAIGIGDRASLFSMVWFSVFGGAAFQVDDRLGGDISEGAAADPAGALFEFIAQYPFALAASLLAIFLVWIFFVAGADHPVRGAHDRHRLLLVQGA